MKMSFGLNVFVAQGIEHSPPKRGVGRSNRLEDVKRA